MTVCMYRDIHTLQPYIIYNNIYMISERKYSKFLYVTTLRGLKLCRESVRNENFDKKTRITKITERWKMVRSFHCSYSPPNKELRVRVEGGLTLMDGLEIYSYTELNRNY